MSVVAKYKVKSGNKEYQQRLDYRFLKKFLNLELKVYLNKKCATSQDEVSRNKSINL